MCLACEVAIEGTSIIEKRQENYVSSAVYNNSTNTSY